MTIECRILFETAASTKRMTIIQFKNLAVRLWPTEVAIAAGLLAHLLAVAFSRILIVSDDNFVITLIGIIWLHNHIPIDRGNETQIWKKNKHKINEAIRRLISEKFKL